MSVPTAAFLCVANSARSQMAEGLARADAPPGWTFYSAGSKPGVLNPLAVEALREVGIDISGHRAKGLEEVPLDEADVLVTLCAEEECPYVPGPMQRLAWPLPDPAATDGDRETRLRAFRSVRDEIRRRLSQLWERP